METFKVELDVYAGPLDLLLYLVRREELDLSNISLAQIADQYAGFIEILSELDIDSVGDFLEIAATLVEMKAKAVLPTNNESVSEAEEPFAEDDGQLVVRLLEYKRFRDAASVLEERSIDWQMRYTRLANDLPTRALATEDQPLERIEVWDLVSAFGRILRESQPAPTETVIYDETPMHVHMKRIHELVRTEKEVELQSLFVVGQHKSSMVAMFLATLELTRHHGLDVRQIGVDGPLLLIAGDRFRADLEVAEVDNMLSEQLNAANLAYRPR
jgi:segregation and condensation protein A